MPAKTTLYLDASLRDRLKVESARANRSMSDLVAEGAELVLQRYVGQADADELRRRAENARRELRGGLYEGVSMAAEADTLLYGR